MILQILFCFIAGLMASLGFGGGFFLLIYLTLIAGLSQLEAQAINLFFFIIVALVSSAFSAYNKLIKFNILIKFLFFGFFGVVFGFLLELVVPVFWVRKLFAVFLLIVGLKELFSGKVSKQKKQL